jgi:hypothetical protein
VLTVVLQLGAGTLLTIGLLTPLAMTAAAGVMIVATWTHLRAGFWSQHGGFESEHGLSFWDLPGRAGSLGHSAYDPRRSRSLSSASTSMWSLSWPSGTIR